MRKMDPKEYYYERFRSQFEEWLRKTSAHEHPGEGTYISVQDLSAENLSHIPKEDYILFHCALACTVLIDQVMHTHFKNEYDEFRKLTLYPKIEYGISNINVNPWVITHSGIGLTTLERFLEFFVKDLQSFFERNKFNSASWQAVKDKMLADKDVVDGSRGEILRKILKKN